MKKYPKIGIRPTIDGRQGGVRESLEEKTMSLAKAVAELISSNLKNGDGSPVECVIADGTIGRVAESAACAEKFEREGVGSTITVTSCWCYGAETMDMNPYYRTWMTTRSLPTWPRRYFALHVPPKPWLRCVASLTFLWVACLWVSQVLSSIQTSSRSIWACATSRLT